MDNENENNWTHHVFSLEETQHVQPELVNKLDITQYEGSDFPQEVLKFKNLNELGVFRATALREVPEEIGELTQLVQLHITGTSIEQLPGSLFKLPNLSILYLMDNQLKNIPADINLPNLTYAAFDQNQLTTLPETLALQPRLSRLSLTENPWESLPSEFNNVKKIDLNIADKRRLLNHEYQGADGKGVIQWDDSPYYVKSDAKLQEVMLEAIKNTMWNKHKDAFVEQALKAICINPIKPDDYSKIGNTRFGGMPDMPKGQLYPTFSNEHDEDEFCHFIFFAQLNCEELAPLQNYLPRRGMLYFYAEGEEDFNCRVMYHPNTEQLQSAKSLADIEINNGYIDEPYTPYAVECQPMVAIPQTIDGKHLYELENETHENMDDQERALHAENNGQAFSESLGRIGVYREHNNVNYSNMNHSINDCSGGIGAGSPNEMAALKCKGDPEEWVLLLRMYSDEKSGFQFNDAGELYFMIHKSDLAKADFSNVYAYSDSS